MATSEAELKLLMIGALDGDAVAYEKLLRLLVPRLRAFFRGRLRNDEMTEDLVQETLMTMHARRATFDRERPFSPWFFAIAWHRASDHFRRNRHSRFVDELTADVGAVDPEPASSAAIDLERLLDMLPPKQGMAIRATKVEGLSVVEAAAAAGISPSDVKVSVHRGLKRLADHARGDAHENR